MRDWSEKLLCKRQLLSQFNKRERRNKAVIVLKYRQWEKGGDQVKKTKVGEVDVLGGEGECGCEALLKDTEIENGRAEGRR